MFLPFLDYRDWRQYANEVLILKADSPYFDETSVTGKDRIQYSNSHSTLLKEAQTAGDLRSSARLLSLSLPQAGHPQPHFRTLNHFREF